MTFEGDPITVKEGINIKEGNIVTVNDVTDVQYRNVLNSMYPKLNTAEIKLVYTTGSDNFVMVEMLDSLRKARVQDVNANAAPLSIGPFSAPAPGIVLANAMQTAMVGLFASSPQNTVVGNVQSSVVTHICITSKCTRFTWDGEPGHCCRTC
jgi:hypothetical protein